MKQGKITAFTKYSVRALCIVLSGLLLVACSATSLRSFDADATAVTKTPVYIVTDCDEEHFGSGRLVDATKRIKEAVSEYGFQVVSANDANFMLYFECRVESDLNFGVIANGISGMLMVASVTLFPTYWPSDLWVNMEIYDLRPSSAEKLDSFESSFVSQERIVWAPFILFKFANDFGLPKYSEEKVYKGLRSSALTMLAQAEKKAAFK